MKLKLPKLCQRCSAEFWLTEEDVNEKLSIDEKGRMWITCPICTTRNIVYVLFK